MRIEAVPGVATGWGESVVWDDRRGRLLFVDCATSTLHWLDDGTGDLHGTVLPSMPTGVVPADDGRWVVVLEDGLHVVDLERGSCDLLVAYPDELGGRCNDACADLDGNLITGKLNLGPAEGSAWWFSVAGGWRLLDDDIANTNGPAVFAGDDASTLVVGDTSAHYWAYDYDPAGVAQGRRLYGDTSQLDGFPDGSTVDAEDGLWCALVRGAQVVRFTAEGIDRTLPMPVSNPTDVTFGGPDLDRLYVTSIGGDGDLDGGLLVVDGLGISGRREPRVALGGWEA